MTMAPLRSPKGFLQIGGVVLVVLGLLGFFGIIGPTSNQSFLGELWFFTTPENWAHLILGVVALIAAFALHDHKQLSLLVYVVGAVALFFGVLGFFLGSETPNLGLGANLENPLDNILHLVVAVWAFWAASGKSMATSSSTPSYPPPPMAR